MPFSITTKSATGTATLGTPTYVGTTPPSGDIVVETKWFKRDGLVTLVGSGRFSSAGSGLTNIQYPISDIPTPKRRAGQIANPASARARAAGSYSCTNSAGALSLRTSASIFENSDGTYLLDLRSDTNSTIEYTFSITYEEN